MPGMYFSAARLHGSSLICLSPSETRSVSALNFNTLTRTWSPTWNSSDGWLTRPQLMSVMWSRPSMPPRSMNAPYSVRFLTMPSTIWPSLRRSSVDSLRAARSFSRSTRRDRTMLPRFLLNLMTLNLKAWPRNESRLRTGRRSTCDPGRNALTPPRMVTERPPLTRVVIVPSISSSRSHAALISSHTLKRSAFSLERTTMPASFSRDSSSTSTVSPGLTSMLPSAPRNSSSAIWPSDL